MEGYAYRPAMGSRRQHAQPCFIDKVEHRGGVWASRVGSRFYDFSTFAFPYGPVDIDTALAHSSHGSMRRWRICRFALGLPSTAFSLHVAVTWNARSMRMRPDGSLNDDRQHWFQRALNVPGGNEVLVFLTKWIGSRLHFECRRQSSFSTVPHGQVPAFSAK